MKEKKGIGNLPAIKRYMELADGRRATMSELKDFKAACTSEELEEFGEQARRILKERGVLK